MDGVLNINKHSGPTSHDIVAKVRRILKEKRVGHAGTLDPLATGVLVVCVGKATRIVEYLVPGQKEYAAELLLGKTTTTQDSAGEETSAADASNITQAMVESVLPQFTGKIQQIPPMVSAIKHEGKRLYELARKNIEVKREPREIEIFDLKITSFTPGENPVVGLNVVCSSGTYIRTLCADIGEALSVGGYMKSLVRTRVGRFNIEDAIDIEQLENAVAEGKIDTAMTSIDDALCNLPSVTMDNDQVWKISHGIAVNLPLFESESPIIRVKAEDGRFVAICSLSESDGISVVTPEKVFAEAAS